ncbi:MAG: tetratricopeptide repeat protein, partial [Planctomycetota bacterium]
KIKIKRRKSGNYSRKEKRIISTAKGKGKQRDKQKSSRRPITGWRLWLFRIVALTLIPALLFLLIELGLRVVGYGFPSTATIKCEVNGRTSYCNNVKFGWRFFPRNIAREFDPFILPADKPDDTYRIFVLGASAAQGVPDGAFSFGRILRVMLQEAYPGINFEVITAAMAAINSHVVVEIADDCARHQPDLFIVYLGNNEVVGPYGPGSIFASLSPHLFLIRAGIALKATKFGQLLTNLLETIGPQKNIPKVWGGMEMFLEKQIRAEDRRLETVYQHFERNLKDISRIACKHGAKTIFCTVGSNLKDCPPFASLHRPDLTEKDKKKWNEIYRQGAAYEADGKYVEAVARYLAAVEIDDCYADLQFRMGRCYWTMGEYSKSRERYIKARELDTLRFRADNQINEIIRAVASNKAVEGAYLVDAVKIFEENNPNEIPREELFYEHVHLNFRGNYLLAKTIFKQIENILPEHAKHQREKDQLLLTESQCAQRLAYNNLARHKIAYTVLNSNIKEPPFTNQLYHKQQVKQLEEKIKVLQVSLTPEALNNTAAEYLRAIEREPSDWWLRWRYALLLSVKMRQYEGTAGQLRLLLQDWPHSYRAHTSQGLLLARLGAFDSAIAEYKKAIKIKPTCANTHYYLGLAYQAQGQFDKAVKYFFITVRLQPNFTKAYDSLGEVLFQQGKLNKAIQAYRRGLLFAPGDVILHYNLGILLEKQGHTAEAIKELQEGLRIDPNSVEIRRALKAFKKKQG